MSDYAQQEMAILQSLADQQVRPHLLPALKPYMFTQDVTKAVFKVVSEDKYREGHFDSRALAIDLTHKGKLKPLTVKKFLNLFGKCPDYSAKPEELVQLLKASERFIGAKLVAQKLRELAKADHSPLAKRGLINALNFTLVPEEFLNLADGEEAQKARDADFPKGKGVIKSVFPMINALSTYGGYLPSQLWMIAARTGVGKTFWMINEAASLAKQGYRVAHMALGDMSHFDLFVRYAACITEINQADIASHENIRQFVEEHPELQAVLNNIRVRSYPAEQYDIYEIIARADDLLRKWPYDAIILDYDSNIRSEFSESLYVAGGGNYNTFKGFLDRRKILGFIGSQTKIAYWQHEVPPMEAAAESSRKQHAVDGQINLGVNPKCAAVGSMNLAKQRRGAMNKICRVRFDFHYARIVPIDPSEYQQIIEDSRKAAVPEENVDFSDGAMEGEPSDESQQAEAA